MASSLHAWALTCTSNSQHRIYSIPVLMQWCPSLGRTNLYSHFTSDTNLQQVQHICISIVVLLHPIDYTWCEIPNLNMQRRQVSWHPYHLYFLCVMVLFLLWSVFCYHLHTSQLIYSDDDCHQVYHVFCVSLRDHSPALRCKHGDGKRTQCCCHFLSCEVELWNWTGAVSVSAISSESND